jgi:hypothetical protein
MELKKIEKIVSKNELVEKSLNEVIYGDIVVLTIMKNAISLELPYAEVRILVGGYISDDLYTELEIIDEDNDVIYSYLSPVPEEKTIKDEVKEYIDIILSMAKKEWQVKSVYENTDRETFIYVFEK